MGMNDEACLPSVIFDWLSRASKIDIIACDCFEVNMKIIKCYFLAARYHRTANRGYKQRSQKTKKAPGYVSNLSFNKAAISKFL